MLIDFVKYHGAGNDFVLIDDRLETYSFLNPSFIRSLCHRKMGIGADGLIFLRCTALADFQMVYFNCDGKEAAMCGNGLRCLVHFLREQRLIDKCVMIQVREKIFSCSIKKDEVAVRLEKPFFFQWNVPLEIDGKEILCDYVDTGVPHAVLFSDNIENIDVEEEGRQIRNHSFFSPLGVNVNFVQIEKNGTIALRTYERGVEAETLGCGTGGAAASCAAWKRWGMTNDIKVRCASNEELVFDLLEEEKEITQIIMTGSATSIFQGKIKINIQENIQ
jgi:diaminopimelate epimerase